MLTAARSNLAQHIKEKHWKTKSEKCATMEKLTLYMHSEV